MNFIKNLWSSNVTFAPSFKEPYLGFAGEGSFYLLEKGQKKPIYDSAKIRFEFPDDEEFVYHLVIDNAQRRATRKQSGKENLVYENSFVISEDMKLKSSFESGKGKDVMRYEWQDEDKTVYGFEFVNRKRNMIVASDFKELLCKLIYQSKHHVYVGDNTSLNEYLRFCKTKKGGEYEDAEMKEENLESPKTTKKKPLVRQQNSAILPNMEVENADPLNRSLSKLEVQSRASRRSNKSIPNSILRARDMNVPASVNSKLNSNRVQKSETSSDCLTIDNRPFAFKANGKLYLLDEDYKFLPIQEDAVFGIKKLGGEKLRLEVYDSNEELIYVQIMERTGCFTFDDQSQTFRWFDLQEDSVKVMAFQLEDDAENGLDKLRETLSNSSGSNRSQSLPSIPAGSEQKQLSTLSDSAVRTNLINRYEEELSAGVQRIKDFLEDEEPEVGAISHSQEQAFSEEVEEEIDNDEEGEEVLNYNKIYKYYEPASNIFESENHSISQSKLLDRVFITRGSVVSVFKANESLDFICTLPQLKTLDNKIIQPKKILFHDKDTKMLILNQDLDTKLYSLDLENGIITSEWTLDGYNNFLDIDHSMKNGELHHNDVFLGMNNKNLFLFDPRNQEQAISMKKYNTNPTFSCFTSTAQGHFAVGNEKGEIRLYKEIGKNAKNIIRTDAERIDALDSTKDGSLLAVTAQDTIMVYSLIINGVNGYLNSIKKVLKAPIILSLPEFIIEKYGITEVQFSKAKFNNSYAGSEKYIVSTVERLLVVWNLEDVAQNINNPKVYALKSKILDCEFRNGRDDGILAILADEVNYIRF